MSKRKFLIPLTAFGLLLSTLAACGGGGGGKSNTSKPADSTTSQGGASTTSQGGASTTSQGGASTTSQGGASTTSQGGGQSGLFENVADPDNHHFGAEEDVAADAESGAIAYKKAACSDTDCNLVKLRINQSQVTFAEGSSNKAGTPEGYVKLNGNNESLSFKFKVDKLSMGKLFFLGRMDGYSTESNRTVGIYRQGSPNIEVKINGVAADLSSKASYKYSDTFGEDYVTTDLSSPSNYLSHEGYVEVCNLTLNEGVNEVVYTRKASQNMIVRDFVFVVEPHTHAFPEEWTEARAPTYTELGSAERVCSCGLKEQKDLNTLPFAIGEEPEATKLNSDGKKVSQFAYNNGAAKVAAVAMKQNSGVFKTVAVEGETEKWTIGDNANVAAADTYKLDKGNALLFKVNVSAAIDNAFISVGAKYVNANARHFYNHLDGGTNGDKDTEDAYRYYTKVNEGEFQPIAFNDYMSAIFGDGTQIAYMPLGKFNLKAGENLIYVRQGNIGYRATLQGNLFIALSGDAQVAGDDAVPQEVAGAYPTFKWADALQEDSAALDASGKFLTNSTYILKVKNVPAAGTYTITLPMKGSNGNGSRVLNGNGQGFSISANDVPGTFYGDGKTYTEFFGEDQTVWVDVLFGEVTLNAGVNIIKIVTNNGGYRVSLNVEGTITIAEPVFAGYSVTFTTEHCKVLVYEGKKYDQTPVETNTTVAMDEDGNVVPYDIEDELPQPQVNFKVVCDEGYSVTAPDNFTITGTYKNLKQNPAKTETPSVDDDTLFRITKVQTDLTVAIVAVEGESAPGKAGAFETEHCSVKVYVGPKSDADRVEDAGPIFYARSKDAPYDVVKTGGQLNFVVTCEDNYEFVPEIDADEKVSFIEGTYKAFKDDGDGCYRITNVQSDLRINIVATETGGGQQAQQLVLDYSGLNESSTSALTADNSLAVVGQGNEHVTAVTTSKIYANTGSGGAFPNQSGMLKSGTSSAAGQIVLTLDVDVTKVEILCHDFYLISEQYPTNSNYFSVNGSEQVLAPYTADGTFGTLSFDLAAASKTVQIDINKRAYIKAITLYYGAAQTPVEIAQPVGNFSGYAVSAADDSNVFTTLALGQEAAYIEVGSLFKTTTTYAFDNQTGLVSINLGDYGTFKGTYDETNGKLINCGIEGAAGAYIKNNNAIELVGAVKFFDCNGTTEELQSTFLRRYMSGSWQEDQTNADRLVSYANGIAGSALQRRGWTGGAVSLNSATNFAGGIEVSNLGFWVYNPGSSDVTLRQWVYKADNRFGDPKAEIGNVVAKAGQWTYCRMGFTKATIYNFQVADFTNSGVALVFDNIALF